MNYDELMNFWTDKKVNIYYKLYDKVYQKDL